MGVAEPGHRRVAATRAAGARFALRHRIRSSGSSPMSRSAILTSPPTCGWPTRPGPDEANCSVCAGRRSTPATPPSASPAPTSKVRPGPVLRATKTHRTYRVAIDDATHPTAVEHRRRAEARAEANDAVLADTAFVFSADADGSTPWLPNRVTKTFIGHLRRAGVGRFRLHDLRHFMATQMLAHGVAVVTVSQRLGHARASPRSTSTAIASPEPTATPPASSPTSSPRRDRRRARPINRSITQYLRRNHHRSR